MQRNRQFLFHSLSIVKNLQQLSVRITACDINSNNARYLRGCRLPEVGLKVPKELIEFERLTEARIETRSREIAVSLIIV